MSVITLEPHQYEQWNFFVSQSLQGDVFCYSWWLEAITRSNFKILAIFENDEIVAGIPIALDSQNKVNEPPLTRTLGVLYKVHETKSKRKQRSDERKWLNELLSYLPLDDFVQMCMHHNFKDWLPFRWKGFKQTTRYTYLIEYRKLSPDDLWQNLDRLRKRMINRSIENNIKVEITHDLKLIYKYESLTYERQGLKFRIPFENLKSLDDAIKQFGNRIIFKAVDHQNQIHAVLYAAYNSKSAYALLSGSDPELRNQGGHTLVMWEAIKYFFDKAEFFNFGGSDIERIESHIRGFGGTLTPYSLIYNERLMSERKDIWFHLGEIKFHLIVVSKILINKVLKTIGMIKS